MDRGQPPSLTLPRRHCFGARGARANSLCWADESTLIYLCGATIVLYQPDTKTQRFVAGSQDAAAITAFAVCPSKRLLAVAERGEKATITIYDLQTLKRRKILSSKDEGTKVRRWRRARPAVAWIDHCTQPRNRPSNGCRMALRSPCHATPCRSLSAWPLAATGSCWRRRAARRTGRSACGAGRSPSCCAPCAPSASRGTAWRSACSSPVRHDKAAAPAPPLVTAPSAFGVSGGQARPAPRLLPDRASVVQATARKLSV